MADTNDELLTPKEVAQRYRIPETTLPQWRYRKKGPPWLRVGRHVRYRRSAVEAWLRANEHSTNSAA